MQNAPPPTWTDQLGAWSAVATLLVTVILGIMAVAAWRNAKQTLNASR